VRRFSGSRTAGICLSWRFCCCRLLLVCDVPVVSAATVDPAVSDALQSMESLQLIVSVLGLASLLYLAFLLWVFLLLLGSCWC
jgi:hypothetical protein